VCWWTHLRRATPANTVLVGTSSSGRGIARHRAGAPRTTLSVLNLHQRSVSGLCRVTKENTVGRKGSSFADSRPSAPRVGLKSNSALYIWQGLALADDPLQWRGRARGNENVFASDRVILKHMPHGAGSIWCTDNTVGSVSRPPDVEGVTRPSCCTWPSGWSARFLTDSGWTDELLGTQWLECAETRVILRLSTPRFFLLSDGGELRISDGNAWGEYTVKGT